MKHNVILQMTVMLLRRKNLYFIICAVKPRPLGRGYKAQSVKAGFVAVEYIV